jgi:uncharacterized protein YodC (DUF2158 family)
MTIKIGDIVCLKSGGPTMMVEAWGGGSIGEFICSWFDGSKRVKSTFQPKALVKAIE